VGGGLFCHARTRLGRLMGAMLTVQIIICFADEEHLSHFSIFFLNLIFELGVGVKFGIRGWDRGWGQERGGGRSHLMQSRSSTSPDPESARKRIAGWASGRARPPAGARRGHRIEGLPD